MTAPLAMSRWTGAGLLWALAAACSGAQPGNRDPSGQVHSPGLTVEHAIAEGTGDPDEPPALTPDAGAADAEASALDELLVAGEQRLPEHTQPDPAPLRLAEQWEYSLHWQGDRGQVEIERVRPLVYAAPVVTPRTAGRFAIELWLGPELIDRVRFDFPLIAADTPPTSRKRRPLAEPPTLLTGADVRRTVRVPASPRATRAILVDRARGTFRDLPWPPDSPLGAPRTSLDAGAP